MRRMKQAGQLRKCCVPDVSRLISFLVPDIGSPTIGAALKLARMLEPDYRTEIVGPDFGRGICSLYRDSYPFRSIPAGRLYRFPDFLWESRRIASELNGDAIVALKGFATTVLVALQARKKRAVPVAVYLDEWDGALWHALSPRGKMQCLLHHSHHPVEPCYHKLVERSIRKADAVLSTTTWLQRRFGGHIVHAGVDCDFFKPQPKEEVSALRKELGLDGKKIIVFGGVVRPHKGVEEILEALCLLDRDDARVLVVGPITDHLQALIDSKRFGKWLVVAGDPMNAPTSRNADIHKQMPLYLDAGDLVVLPLRNTLLAQSQMPIKIFEAMAMAKPVIGTAVSDLPQILESCGRVVPPNNPSALAEAIRDLFDNSQLACEYGQRAREKCIREYSREATSATLLGIMDLVLHNRQPPHP